MRILIFRLRISSGIFASDFSSEPNSTLFSLHMEMNSFFSFFTGLSSVKKKALTCLHLAPTSLLLMFDALCDSNQVIPEKCRYQILSTKIEIRLAKAEAIQWKSLDYSKEATVAQKVIVPSGRCLS